MTTMKLSNTFSFSRFSQVGCKMIVENKKPMIMRLLVMFAIILLILCWASYLCYTQSLLRSGNIPLQIDPARDRNAIIFTLLLFCFGIYSASLMMEDLRTKGGRIAALTLPVTPFENWFARWIIHVVLFLGVYFVLFFAADYIRVLLFSSIYSKSHLYISLLNLKYAANSLGDGFVSFILFYFGVQSFYVLGSIFFPRHSLLRTTIAGFFAVIVIVFLDYIIAKNIVCPGSVNIHFGQNLGSIILLVLIIFNWVISYYRFKEIEIIDRL